LVKAAVFKHAKNVYALHFVQTFARRARGGALARMWTEDSALRLRKRMPSPWPPRSRKMEESQSTTSPRTCPMKTGPR
jgi:hypothetical protein